jgi:hypothetical protein
LFYVNKKNTEDVVELIHSEAGVCIVVDQQDTLMSGNPSGRILRMGKKQFKKTFKKASTKFIKIEPTDEYKKKEIIEHFMTDKFGIMNYTEDYVERMKYTDRKEYFENLSDEEYEKSLEDLADPVVSKKSINYKDLLKAKQTLQSVQTSSEV